MILDFNSLNPDIGSEPGVTTYASLTAFFADPPAASRAWVCTIDGVQYAGIGADGMQRLLWSGLWIPTAEIPDNQITLLTGQSSQVARDGSNNLVLSCDANVAATDDVLVRIALLEAIRFPGALSAKIRLTAGAMATGDRFGVRVSDGTAYIEASLQKATSGYERDSYDNLGTATTASSLAGLPAPGSQDTIVTWSIVPKFPSRHRSSIGVNPADTAGNGGEMVPAPGSNNFDLSASSSQTGHMRLYAVASGTAAFSITVYAVQAMITPSLEDPWN